MKSDLSLSVFFPFYNEEANVEKMVRSALDIVPRLARDFEIILVDDGSRDRTAAIADALCRRHSGVRMVRHSHNKGYGSAVISGLRAATKEWVFFTDGDGQFDLSELPKMLEKTAGSDAILGYRLKRNDPFFRTMNSWLWKTLVRLLFGIRVKDLNCAFKLFRRQDVQALNLESQGAFITVELLARLKKRGARFEEVGVHHYPRLAGEPTGARFSVILRAFWELLKLWKSLEIGSGF